MKDLRERHRRTKTIVDLGDLGREPAGEPACPYCRCRVLRRKEWIRRRVWDIGGPIEITAKRYKCLRCGKSFHHYPKGVSWKSPYSNRVWFLAVLLWHLGLSVESTAIVIRALTKGRVSPKTIYEHLLAAGFELNKRLKARKSEMARVVHVDQGYIRIEGKTWGFNITVSPEGALLDVEFIRKEDKETFNRVFKKIKRRHKTELVIGDFHPGYDETIEGNGMIHGGCWFHHQRSMFRRARKTRDPTIKDLLHAGTLPWPELEDDFFEGGLEAPPGETKEILWLVSDRIGSVNMGSKLRLTPGFTTNNPAERAIGRTKIRYKLTRGFGSLRGAYSAILITQALGEAFERGMVSSEALLR